MRILHIYRHDHPRLAEYVRLLSQAMPADVECAFADNASDVRLAFREFRPDIVHQHGHLPFPVSQSRLVVSPHGETTDTSKAYVVVARSPYELSCCDNERKELVRNPLITRTITFEAAAAALSAVYQRVMNSHPLELMDGKTRRLLAILLKAGLLGDKGWVSDEINEKPLLPIPGNQASHLFMYADLEGVLDIVQRGIDVVGLADVLPSTPPARVDCYLPHGYKRPTPLAGANILEIMHDIEANGLTLLRLTELTRQLYDDGLDEAHLMQQIDAMNARPQLQLLLQILSEQTLLTEGFMPCQPLDNSFAENLRQQIENHLRVI